MLFTHHLEIMFEWERKQPTSFTNFIFCRSEKIANRKGAILPSFAFNTWCFSVLLGLEVQTGVAVGCGWILPKPMFAACLRQFSMLVWPSLKRVYICKKKLDVSKSQSLFFLESWVPMLVAFGIGSFYSSQRWMMTSETWRTSSGPWVSIPSETPNFNITFPQTRINLPSTNWCRLRIAYFGIKV